MPAISVSDQPRHCRKASSPCPHIFQINFPGLNLLKFFQGPNLRTPKDSHCHQILPRLKHNLSVQHYALLVTLLKERCDPDQQQGCQSIVHSDRVLIRLLFFFRIGVWVLQAESVFITCYYSSAFTAGLTQCNVCSDFLNKCLLAQCPTWCSPPSHPPPPRIELKLTCAELVSANWWIFRNCVSGLLSRW